MGTRGRPSFLREGIPNTRAFGVSNELRVHDARVSGSVKGQIDVTAYSRLRYEIGRVCSNRDKPPVGGIICCSAFGAVLVLQAAVEFVIELLFGMTDHGLLWALTLGQQKPFQGGSELALTSV
jgi:hypothetical protein